MPFVYHCRLRFADTDASGRIHNAAIFRYFEAAEVEFLRAAGIPYSYIDTLGIRYPRVRVEADFLGALVDDDLMAITVTLDHLGTRAFTLGFLVEVDGTPRARGKIVICCMDPLTERSCPIPPDLVKILQTHA
ncbi:MAG: acyl-CoA thioesterase [Bryobacteraceae bacterium]|nr:acyl-CoA thioesterase [Bryobacteraceae bacterium]